MAYDEDRRPIEPKIIDKPKRAFEIEIGRFVEKQKIRLRKQNGGERDAHPPAAGKLIERPLLRRFIEAETRQDGCGARRRGMRQNIDKARMNFADAGRIGSGSASKRARSRSAVRTKSIRL